MNRDELGSKANAEIARLRALVEEWLCSACRTVYPGPPQPGVWCVICPRCGGPTRARADADIAALSEENARLRGALEGIAAQGFGLQGLLEDDAPDSEIADYWKEELFRKQEIARAALAGQQPAQPEGEGQ